MPKRCSYCSPAKTPPRFLEASRIGTVDSMSKSTRSVSEQDSGIADMSTSPDGDVDTENDDWRFYDNKLGLSTDLRFLAGMPELCDVMFLVGEQREPVYGVKAVLAIRSRVFYKMLFGPKSAVSSKHKITSIGPNPRRLQKMLSDASPIRFSMREKRNFGTQRKTSVFVEEFDADVFKELLEFLHTGSVTLCPKTLLGVMNAADHFAVEDLRKACADFSKRCISLETVCSLLVTAERYIQYKSTKIFVQRVLEFVDRHGEDVLTLCDFVHLPQHVVELILSREDLAAAELTKYRAVERWCRHFLLYHRDESLTALMRPFVHYLKFEQIPTSVLMREIRPLKIVDDSLLMAALATQADPRSIPRKGNLSAPKRPVSSALFDRSTRENRSNFGKCRSVDRNLSSKSSHASSGYNSNRTLHETVQSTLVTAEMLKDWSNNGRLCIEPVGKLGDKLSGVKSKSVADLSSQSLTNGIGCFL